MKWEEISGYIDQLYQKQFEVAKRLDKQLLPQNHAETLTEYIARYNKLSKYVGDLTQKVTLTEEHKKYVKDIFESARDKVLKVFGRHGWKIKVPASLGSQIDQNVEESEESEESEDEDMAEISAAEVLNQASKVLFPFNGEPENLQSFVDALTLINTIRGGHEQVAVTQIKTHLRGNARAMITNEATILEIIARLQARIKSPTSDEILSKLNAVDARQKTPQEYATIVEELGNKLKMSYIAEQIPVERAEEKAAKDAIRTIITSSGNNSVINVLQAADLKTVAAVTTKFLEVRTTQQQHMMHYRGNRGNNARGNRGKKNYNNYNNSGNYNNYYNNGNYNNNNQRGNGRGNRYNDRRGNNRGNRNNGNRGNYNNGYVRNMGPGNGQPPQGGQQFETPSNPFIHHPTNQS